MSCCCSPIPFSGISGTGGGGPPPPTIVADFTYDYVCNTAYPDTSPYPLAAQFIDTSSPAPSSWLWDFGDGATSTLQYPSHAYAAAGDYVVTLTVNGGASSKTYTLHFLNSGSVVLPFDGIATEPDIVTLIGSYYSGIGVTFSDGYAINHDFGSGHTSVGMPNFSTTNILQYSTTFNFVSIEFYMNVSGTAQISLYNGADRIFLSSEIAGDGTTWDHYVWNICDKATALFSIANGFKLEQSIGSTVEIDTITMIYAI